MSDSRPPVPRPLVRQVKFEAGFRCAIPACRQHPIEIHHIEDWAKVRAHTFDNLIALCGVCHARVTRGEIDRTAVLQYKANLAIVNARYEGYERRLLRVLGAQVGQADKPVEKTAGGLDFLFRALIEDGLVIGESKGGTSIIRQGRAVPVGVATETHWSLTELGEDFVKQWFGNDPLDDD